MVIVPSLIYRRLGQPRAEFYKKWIENKNKQKNKQKNQVDTTGWHGTSVNVAGVLVWHGG